MTEQPLDTAKIEEAIEQMRNQLICAQDLTDDDNVTIWGISHWKALDLLVRVAEIYVELLKADRRRNPYVVRPKEER